MPANKIVAYAVEPRFLEIGCSVSSMINESLSRRDKNASREMAEAELRAWCPMIDPRHYRIVEREVDFTKWCDTRRTSEEIGAAIWSLADSLQEANRIWDDPSQEELTAIWEYVTRGGLYDASNYYWGAAENNWALGIINEPEGKDDDEESNEE